MSPLEELQRIASLERQLLSRLAREVARRDRRDGEERADDSDPREPDTTAR